MAKTILKNILKNETVFCAALLLAILSAFLVRPDEAYFTYPDWRTISLLFCLMILVAGLRSKGLFTLLGHALLSGQTACEPCQQLWYSFASFPA